MSQKSPSGPAKKDASKAPPPPSGLPSPRGKSPMKLLVAVLVLAAAAVGLWFAFSGDPAPPVQGYRVVATYPHDKGVYTQGLIVEEPGILLEGGGKMGQSALRRVKLATGEQLLRKGLASEYFGEGICLFGDKIYQLTWRDELAVVYGKSDFEKLKTFKYKGEGWGLTTDGKRLIRSDGTARLVFHDPETFAELSEVPVTAGGKPVPGLNELEWIDGEVWANIYTTDRIARIDPATGKVTAFLDLSGIIDAKKLGLKPNDEVLNGIAYDPAAKKIYVTGKNWPSLFEIEVVEKP